MTHDQIANGASKATYASAAATTVAAGLSWSEIVPIAVGIVGIVVAILTFLANCYFKRKQLLLDTMRTQAEVEALRHGAMIHLGRDDGE